MTKAKWNISLPWIVLLLGDLGMGLRRWLYAAALDGRRLLPPGHPLEICLWVLTAATLAAIILTVRKLNGDGAYEHNFFPSPLAALGHLAAGVGIAVTVVSYEPILPGTLGALWVILGTAALPCLAGAGYCRLKGKKPFFLLYAVVCLFFILHLVNHYRFWSGKPQLESYAFSLFGTVSMALFALYTTSFSVDLPRRRMQLATGMLGVYLCAVCLSDMRYPWMYLGCIAWAVTGLCTLEPKPLPPKPKEDGEKPKEEGKA